MVLGANRARSGLRHIANYTGYEDVHMAIIEEGKRCLQYRVQECECGGAWGRNHYHRSNGFSDKILNRNHVVITTLMVERVKGWKSKKNGRNVKHSDISLSSYDEAIIAPPNPPIIPIWKLFESNHPLLFSISCPLCRMVAMMMNSSRRGMASGWSSSLTISFASLRMAMCEGELFLKICLISNEWMSG